MSLKVYVSIVLVFLISACGGHGYEGKYTMKVEEGAMAELFRTSGQEHLLQENIVEIGTDFQEGAGQRTTFDNIFEREKDGKKELVFVLTVENTKQELPYEIIDDNTLRADFGNGLTYIYKRI